MLHVIQTNQYLAMIDGREIRITHRKTASGTPPEGFAEFVTVLTGEMPGVRDGQQVVMRGQRVVPIHAASIEEAFMLAPSCIEAAQKEMETEMKRALSPIVIAQPAAIKHNGKHPGLRIAT